MDGMTSASLDSIVAPLNFLAPMAEKPVAYNYEPPPGRRRAPVIMSSFWCRSATPGR